MRKICNDSKCRRRGKELPIEDFSRNVSRKDGYETACKECRKRAYAKWKAGIGKPKHEKEAARMPTYRESAAYEFQRKPNVISRVENAIRGGARTRESIVTATNLDMDTVCDGLAELVDRNVLKPRKVGEDWHFERAA